MRRPPGSIVNAYGWRRDTRTGWPSRLPVYTIVLLILSMLTVAGVWYSRYMRVWTPLERHYLSAYVRAQISGTFRDNGWYILLQIVTTQGGANYVLLKSVR